MTISIKNMVCNRCKMIVSKLLTEQGYNVLSVELGEVKINKQELSNKESSILDKSLNKYGFELLLEEEMIKIERIKNLIIQLVYDENSEFDKNLSTILQEKFHQDYSSISKLFSKKEGTTIEKYFINLKIERAKELIIYNQLSLSEIAYRLNYSSTAHLSNQFKKTTGVTPRAFKKTHGNNRQSIDEL